MKKRNLADVMRDIALVGALILRARREGKDMQLAELLERRDTLYIELALLESEDERGER